MAADDSIDIARAAADLAGRRLGEDADATRTVEAVRQLLDTLALPGAAAGSQTASQLVFDVSDMFGYYELNRLPTGVQRVQTGIVLALLDALPPGEVALVRFLEGRDAWLAVPADLFREVSHLSMAGGDPHDAGWRTAVARLEHAATAGEPYVFARGATLVNLGTSWWLPNYFMHIRRAKAAHGIRYVPMIHDVIPVLFPEQVIPDLVHEFIDWLMGVVRHGDAFVANSDATRADFLAVTARMGCPVAAERIGVMPLQAEMPPLKASRPAGPILSRFGLAAGNYVLLVSTIDVRKNQIGAFSAWQTLLDRHGPSKVPQLVCVGKLGFDGHAVAARRDATAALRDKVTILHEIADEELAALYRNCLFTLYPTLYEGWGLPVSEALAYGKVPLTSDNSSLPQAGQGLSVMVRSGSSEAIAVAAERLVFDHRHRQEQEARIAREFRPRGWGDVAADLRDHLARFTALEQSPWSPPPAAAGWYPLTRNRAMRVTDETGTAEPYRMAGWRRLDDFGCWTTPGGGTLRLAVAPGTRRIGLHLAGFPGQPCRVTVAIAVGGQGAAIEERLPADADRWLFVDLPPGTGGDLAIHVRGDVAGKIGDVVVGVGVRAFFVFDPADPRSRLDFVEAAAFRALPAFRRSAPC